MNHYLSTHVFVGHRLTTALLGRIRQAGVPAVEIFCARQHLDYYNKAQIDELGHWFRDSDLKLHALHAPIHNDEIWGRSGPHAIITLTEPIKSKRIPMVDEIKRALDIAEIAPYRYLIQHLGVPGEEFSLEKVDACFAALEELAIFARQRGVEILLENTPNDLSTPERLVQFNELTHLNLNFAFDTGHANLAGGVADSYRIMKSRIRSTHVHDNDGKVDAHLFPILAGGGTIDWVEAMRLLRSGESQYPLLLELKEKPDIPHPLESALEVFDKLEAL
jgi:sugar phosphate isomerase/epimerase